MEELGISGSYSRPRVSNNNQFSEALFKTLKTAPHGPVMVLKI
jgi:putative transposase